MMVGIEVADLADDRPVDVAADDARNAVVGGVADDGFLEFAYEGDGVLDALLCERTEGPIAETKPAAKPVERDVQLQKELVADIADEGEPAHVLDDGIEFVAVHDEKAASIRGEMDVVFLHGDGAVDAEEIGKELVVVAGDVDDLCAFAAFAEDLLDDVAVLLRPVDAAAEFPDVDEIADDVEGVEFVVPEELEEGACVASHGAEMHI